MLNDTVRLDIYSPLAAESPQNSPLLFSVDTANILDYEIEPDCYLQDEAFDIRGRTASITTLWAGAFQAWIQAKLLSDLYPEYLDAIIDIVDDTNNVILFRGALCPQDIDHDYDAQTVRIMLRDSIDIWITQAKKWYYTATEDSGTCSLAGPSPSLLGMLWYPTQYLLKGMNAVLMSYTNTYNTNETVDGLELVIDGYNDDFSTWIPRYGLLTFNDPSYEARHTVVQYDDTKYNIFHANFIHIFEVQSQVANVPVYYYRVLKVTFDETALFQPKSIKYVEVQADSAHDSAFFLRKLVLSPGYLDNVSSDSGHVVVTNSYVATRSVNGEIYSVGISGDKVIISSPYNAQSLQLTEGKHSYSDMVYALMTANALSLGYSSDGRRYVINSLLSDTLDFTGGTVIGNSNIFNQKRSGILADMSKLDSALSITKFNVNLTNALKKIYKDRFAVVGAKLSFQMLDTYKYNSLYSIRSKIVIDGLTYVISQVSYPNNGMIEIECIGEWE